MRFLKPKVGTGAILEDTPDHLPNIGMFKVYDMVVETLEAIPLKRKK